MQDLTKNKKEDGCPEHAPHNGYIMPQRPHNADDDGANEGAHNVPQG